MSPVSFYQATHGHTFAYDRRTRAAWCTGPGCHWKHHLDHGEAATLHRQHLMDLGRKAGALGSNP